MFARVNDTQIFFDVVGEQLDSSTSLLEEKPTIVMLHGGLGFDHGYLRPGLNPLSAKFSLLYFDMRGQGISENVPFETITLEQCADDAVALLDHLGIDEAFFFGHSAGGYVAQLVALRHPERVRGLILSNTSSGHRFTEEERREAKSPMLSDRASTPIQEIARTLFSPASLEEMLDKKRIEAHWMFLQKVGPYYMAPGNEDKFLPVMKYSLPSSRVMDHFVATLLPHFDLTDQLEWINTPTLIIAGAYDWVCTPLASRYLAEHIKVAEFVLFEDCGHMPFIEDPERFIDVVVTFIRKTLP